MDYRVNFNSNPMDPCTGLSDMQQAGVHIIPKIADFLKKISPHFFQICQSQMGFKKELYGPLPASTVPTLSYDSSILTLMARQDFLQYPAYHRPI